MAGNSQAIATGDAVLASTGNIDPSVSSYVHLVEKDLRGLIHRQFAFVTLAVGIAALLLVGVLAAVLLFGRAPSNTALITAIEDSNEQLSSVAQALLQPQADITVTQQALALVIEQSGLHEKAIEEIRAAEQQPTPEGQSLIQIVGFTAILALLGVLGFQRLQNIDTEISHLRESVFAQAEARKKDTEQVLKSTIDAQVEKQFAATREAIEGLSRQPAIVREDLERQAGAVLDQLQQEVSGVMGELREVRELLAKYPWLKSRDKFDSATRINQLSSVEQAHRLAVEFNASRDNLSAREALRQIVSRKLPGSANDFHNACVEAMDMQEVVLASDIVESGLDSFPDQYDLMADKILGLRSLGRAQEARQLIEDWRRRKPEEFTRGWRPVVFYVGLFGGLDLTAEAVASVESALQEVVGRQPHEIKAWSAYAEFVRDRGRAKEAERILRRALRLNPLSQQLNYVLGELLLMQGKAQQACDYLEKALRCDYQSQYQHDVNQFAAHATLAQAYEACDEPAKARVLYQHISGSSDRDAHPKIKEYARNRLAAISVLGGSLPDQEVTGASQEELFGLLRSLSEMQSNASEKAERLDDDVLGDDLRST